MSLTIPRIALPISVAASSGPHVTILYDDGTSENVTIGTGAAQTFFVQSDNTTTDLLKALDDALTSAASVTTASVTMDTTTHKVTITTSGAKTVDRLTFTTTQVLLRDFGYALQDTTTQLILAGGSATSQYRPRSIWSPSTQDFDGLATRQDQAISASAQTGAGVDDIYEGHTTSSHDIPEVYGALLRNSVVALASHAANVNGLTTGDTNATLETWLQELHKLLGGARPSLRWTPDVTSPTTYEEVRIIQSELLSSIEGWIESTNKAPLFHDLRFVLSRVPS